MIRLRVLFFIAILFITIAGCFGSKNTDQLMAEDTEAAISESNRQLGLPNIKNYTEKRTLKWVYELCDKTDLVNYAYLTSMDGQIGAYLGRCIGYGIPYSAQYSTPETFKRFVSKSGSNVYYEMAPLAEPNGIFKPEGLAATWLIIISPNGELAPMYVEQEILVSPFKMHDGDILEGDKIAKGVGEFSKLMLSK